MDDQSGNMESCQNWFMEIKTMWEIMVDYAQQWFNNGLIMVNNDD